MIQVTSVYTPARGSPRGRVIRILTCKENQDAFEACSCGIYSLRDRSRICADCAGRNTEQLSPHRRRRVFAVLQRLEWEHQRNHTLVRLAIEPRTEDSSRHRY